MKNTKISIYRAIALSLSRGIHFSDMLFDLGISSIFIYGLGEIGQLLRSDLEITGEIKIIGMFDKRLNSDYSCLKESDAPIIVTPMGKFDEIRSQLKKEGIDTKRLLSITQIISISEYLTKDRESGYLFNSSKEFLVVGANFDNKGSQAMTFVAMSELRKRFDKCLVWLLPNFWDDIYINEPYKMITLEDGMGIGSVLSEIIPRITAIIDVSGYAFSSTKGFGATDRIISYLKMAYDHNIPYFFMPQSFGPIDYPSYRIAEMKELLSYANVVYAREKAGKKLLEDKFGLFNVRLSSDLVLQNQSIKSDDCYYSDVERKKNVNNSIRPKCAIVPNINIKRYISESAISGLYIELVQYLLNSGIDVDIILHSNDVQICNLIYETFRDETRVNYCMSVKDCFEFSQIITGYEFAVVSRYHSAVHAYKCLVPCVVIGWADKYAELASSLEQEKYLFDCRNGISYDDVIDAVRKLMDSVAVEKATIERKLSVIQKENCFNILDEIV